MGGRMFVTNANFVCEKKLATQLGGGTSGAGDATVIVIKAPIGLAKRCRNYPDDVKAIQSALNRFPPEEGGPVEKLKVDGLVGPKTNKAIGHFQKKWDLVADYVVDPEGPTIKRLRLGPTGKSDFPAEFLLKIPRAMQIITAARAAVFTARTRSQFGAGAGPIPSIGGFAQAAFNKVDRHFHVSKLKNWARRLDDIERIYLNMQVAIGYVPQGVILAVNEPPSVAEGAFMFTFEGGYHKRGKKDTWHGIAMASIYLCPKSRTLDQDGFVYAMIHELAHYVGPANNGIDDHAYFHKNALRYANLDPESAYRNADCYSQFAFEVIGRKDFNVEHHR